MRAHTLGHGSCPACQRDTTLRIEEIAKLEAQNRNLLAALEAFVGAENASDRRGPRWDAARLDEAGDQARAAIAAATGEKA